MVQIQSMTARKRVNGNKIEMGYQAIFRTDPLEA